MAQFETIGGHPFESTIHGDNRLTIPLGKPVQLVLRGVDSGGAHLIAKPALKSFVEVVKVDDIAPDLLLVTIKGIRAGWEKLEAFDGAGRSHAMVKIITGKLEPHTGMAYDLLHEQLAESGDADKMHLLRQILENQDGNTFNQQHPANVARFGSPLACGKVVEASWNDLGLNKVHIDLIAYHNKLPGKISTANKVTYKEATLRSGRESIKRFLAAGTAVRVGVMLSPAKMTVVNGELVCYNDGGHYVLIVGCNTAADQFLYIDPYPEGSWLVYGGGFKQFDSYKEYCKHLGIFIYKKTPTNPIVGRRHVIIQDPATAGFGMELVRGPR